MDVENCRRRIHEEIMKKDDDIDDPHCFDDNNMKVKITTPH